MTIHAEYCGVSQDGDTFYSRTGGVIKTYRGMVKHDYDIVGAEKARNQFLKDYPNSTFEQGVGK